MVRHPIGFRFYGVAIGLVAPVALYAKSQKDGTFSLTSKSQGGVLGKGPAANGRVPRWAQTVEANALVSWGGQPEHGPYEWSLKADLSALGALSGGFRGQPPPRPHDRRRAWLSTNELFAFVAPVPSWDISLGKRRNSWGPAYSFNPLDTLYPPKNPLDPSQQKQGIWLVQTNILLGPWTFTALYSPEVVDSSHGVPEKMGAFARAPGEAKRAHTVAVVRANLLGDAWESNLMYAHRNRYLNNYQGHQWGISHSLQWTKSLQIHGEGVVQSGTARPRPFLGPQGRVVWQRRLENKKVYGTGVLGTRWQTPTEAVLVVEWLHQGDGFTRNDFALFRKAWGAPGGAPPPQVEGGGLAMRNYGLISYQRLKLDEDVYGGGSLLHNLQDGSGVVTGQVQWSRWDNLQITTSASWHYKAALEPFIVDSADPSREFGMAPAVFQGTIEIKYVF